MLYYLVNFDHTLETWTQRQEVKKTRDSLPPVYFSFAGITGWILRVEKFIFTSKRVGSSY